MLDNDIWTVLLPLISVPLKEKTGLDDLEVIQAYQPTSQGVPKPPFLALHRLRSRRYGSPAKTKTYNELNGNFDTNDIQIMAGTYQARALATQNPEDTSLPTAYDIAAIAAGIMQTDSFMAALRAENIGIYRITSVRTPYFVDDRQRFEQSPTFDFTLVYNRTTTSTVPVVNSLELEINRV